jgi:hypothetical protein
MEIELLSELRARLRPGGYLDLRGITGLAEDLVARLGIVAQLCPVQLLLDGSQPDAALTTRYQGAYRPDDDQSGLLPREWRFVLDLRPEGVRGT